VRIVEPSVELIWVTPEPLAVIEAAGRTCYKSEGKAAPGSAPDFVRMLIRRGHEAVIEHAAASFRIVTDRGITHEIVRHRLASYAQESTRYCNYAADRFGSEIGVLRPPGLDAAQEARWREACEAAEHAYLALLESGASPQLARAVLPTCLKTEIVMTANFREWRHFLRLRLAEGAHPQIVTVAELLRDRLLEACPPVFEEFAPGASGAAPS
jgi:thymidylate synthase (FAD)